MPWLWARLDRKPNREGERKFKRYQSKMNAWNESDRTTDAPTIQWDNEKDFKVGAQLALGFFHRLEMAYSFIYYTSVRLVPRYFKGLEPERSQLKKTCCSVSLLLASFDEDQGSHLREKNAFFTQKISRLRKSENAVRLLYAKNSDLTHQNAFSLFVFCTQQRRFVEHLLWV